MGFLPQLPLEEILSLSRSPTHFILPEFVDKELQYRQLMYTEELRFFFLLLFVSPPPTTPSPLTLSLSTSPPSKMYVVTLAYRRAKSIEQLVDLQEAGTSLFPELVNKEIDLRRRRRVKVVLAAVASNKFPLEFHLSSPQFVTSSRTRHPHTCTSTTYILSQLPE